MRTRPKMTTLLKYVLLAFSMVAVPAGATDTPYAGQETRTIKSLSAADLKALQAGEGWELAKAAELNGYPGPAHVLELSDELGLDDEQRRAVQTIFDRMRAEAKLLGERYIEAEQALDTIFADQSASPQTLKARTDAAASILGDLRAAHLQAHLEIRPLLTQHQIKTYQELRGYNHAQGAAHGAH